MYFNSLAIRNSVCLGLLFVYLMLALRGRRAATVNHQSVEPNPNNNATLDNNNNSGKSRSYRHTHQQQQRSNVFTRYIPSIHSFLLLLTALLTIDFIRSIALGLLGTWNTQPVLLHRALAAITVLLSIPPIAVAAVYKWKQARVKSLVICLMALPAAFAFDLIQLCLVYMNNMAYVLAWLIVKVTTLALANILLFTILRKHQNNEDDVDFAPGDEQFFRRYSYILSYIPMWGPVFWVLVKRRFRRYNS